MKRAPSVREYARLAERARTAAEAIAQEQVKALESRRDELKGADWVRPLLAGAEAERRAALDNHPEDTPEIQRSRVLAAKQESANVAHRKYMTTKGSAA